MTTILHTERPRRVADPIHRSDEYHVTNTFVATLDASLEAASRALRAIDPTASLARRLTALGVEDRAVWIEPCATGGAPERGFLLLWRFGTEPGETAKVAWQSRLDQDGEGRTVLTITLRARGSDDRAGRRIALAWPVVETFAREHAQGLRRAIENSTEHDD
jgi:hypothetical protein